MDAQLYQIAKQFNTDTKRNLNYDNTELFSIVCSIFANDLLTDTDYTLDYELVNKLNYLINHNLKVRINNYD